VNADIDLDSGITITALDDTGAPQQIAFLPPPPTAGLGEAEDQLRCHGWVINASTVLATSDGQPPCAGRCDPTGKGEGASAGVARGQGAGPAAR
jgi:hypothetical protein